MNRIEENKQIVEFMVEKAKQNPSGTFENMVTFQLGAIATMLSDISKSLAVIADKEESEGNEV